MPQAKAVLGLALSLVLICLTRPLSAAEAPLQLRHLSAPDGRSAAAGGLGMDSGSEMLLEALVQTGAGEPVEGVTVYFDQVAPAPRVLGTALSDRGGIARFIFSPQATGGLTSVTARVPEADPAQGQIVFEIAVRNRHWVLLMLVGLAGGLGLFLFGMDSMSASLKRSAGGKLRSILSVLTKNRFVGMAVGIFMTMVIQSSSATTVMLVSFVQAGLMSFAQTLGVILGADIGTTITTQIIAFRVTEFSLVMVAVGFGLKVMARRNALGSIGEILFGFGILFYGMHIMSLSMSPLHSYGPFLELLPSLENPILGILIGLVITALIHTSGAFIGIVIVMAQQGFLTLTAGIPLIFGANIGTCITAILASARTGREARRVALAHTCFKILGVLLFVGWIPWFADLVRAVSPGGEAAAGDQAAMARVIPREIANAHTIFNVSLALLFLPFTQFAARAIERILPDAPVTAIEPRLQARFLDRTLLTTPALALSLAKVEILRMGGKVMLMAEKVTLPFLAGKLSVCDELHAIEEEVDALDQQITSYLLEIGKQNLGEERGEEVYLMMNVARQYEYIADIIDKELRPLARAMFERGVDFSHSGREEVEAYHLAVIKQIARSLDAFKEGSLAKARRITEKQAKYDALEEKYRQAHFHRIRSAVAESLATSEFHLDLMDGLQRINSYSLNIAHAILSQEPGSPEPSAAAP